MISQDVIDSYLKSECLHPLKVFNKYTNEVLYVPCGRCYSCLKNKSNRDTSLAMNMSSHFKYCYFVFLSYEDKFLPYMKLTQIDKIDDSRNLYTFESVNRNMTIRVSKNFSPKGKIDKRGNARIIDDDSFTISHSMTSDEYQDIIVKSHGLIS